MGPSKRLGECRAFLLYVRAPTSVPDLHLPREGCSTPEVGIRCDVDVFEDPPLLGGSRDGPGPVNGDVPVKAPRQFKPGHMKYVPSVKARWLQAPRQVVVVLPPRTCAMCVVETPPAFRCIQVGVSALEDVKWKAPWIAATLAFHALAPRFIVFKSMRYLGGVLR